MAPSSTQPDEEMADASPVASPAAANGDESGDLIVEALAEQRIRVLPGATETAASFEFEEEDHTLGNALRWMIMKNPDVEFCGYSIPHPSEAKMNVRIQTYDSTTAFEALEKGFEELIGLCEVVEEKFTVARDAFVAEHGVPGRTPVPS